MITVNKKVEIKMDEAETPCLLDIMKVAEETMKINSTGACAVDICGLTISRQGQLLDWITRVKSAL